MSFEELHYSIYIINTHMIVYKVCRNESHDYMTIAYITIDYITIAL